MSEAATRHIPLARLLRVYRPVEQLDNPDHDWDREAQWLYANHPRRMARLRYLITEEGIETPIRLCWGTSTCGPEHHVVDGHHRVVIARDLGITTVPTADAWDGSGWEYYADPRGGDDPPEGALHALLREEGTP